MSSRHSKPKVYVNAKADLRRSQRLSQKLLNKNAADKNNLVVMVEKKGQQKLVGSNCYSMDLFVESDMQTSQFPLNQQKLHYETTNISKRKTDSQFPEVWESRSPLICNDYDSKGNSNNQDSKQTVLSKNHFDLKYSTAKRKQSLVTKYMNRVDFSDEKIVKVKKTKPITTNRALKPLEYYAPSAKHLKSVCESLLPAVYPAHFSNVTNAPPVNTYISTTQTPNVCRTLYPTPDEDDFDAISTPSLPESLRDGDVFSDDIREILNLDEIVYRLTESHVKKLASILKLNAKTLFDALEKIFEPQTAAGRERVVLPELYIPSHESSNTESSIVVATPSPPERRYFPSQRRTLSH